MRATDAEERVDVLAAEVEEAQLLLGQPDRGLDSAGNAESTLGSMTPTSGTVATAPISK